MLDMLSGIPKPSQQSSRRCIFPSDWSESPAKYSGMESENLEIWHCEQVVRTSNFPILYFLDGEYGHVEVEEGHMESSMTNPW